MRAFPVQGGRQAPSWQVTQEAAPRSPTAQAPDGDIFPLAGRAHTPPGSDSHTRRRSPCCVAALRGRLLREARSEMATGLLLSPYRMVSQMRDSATRWYVRRGAANVRGGAVSDLSRTARSLLRGGGGPRWEKSRSTEMRAPAGPSESDSDDSLLIGLPLRWALDEAFRERVDTFCHTRRWAWHIVPVYLNENCRAGYLSTCVQSRYCTILLFVL